MLAMSSFRKAVEPPAATTALPGRAWPFAGPIGIGVET
jgi:hypothetical protein